MSSAPLADPSVGSVVVEEVSSRCLSARSAAWSIPVADSMSGHGAPARNRFSIAPICPSRRPSHAAPPSAVRRTAYGKSDSLSRNRSSMKLPLCTSRLDHTSSRLTASGRCARSRPAASVFVVMVLMHSAQAHKEYRFIFAVIPLWLLVGADLATRLTARLDARRQARSSPKAAAGHSFAKSVPAGVMAAVFAAVSVAGILNALPYQHHVYRGYSPETGIVRFIRNQDPIFAAYRYLARAPGVAAVWQTDRAYFNLPGYYYLHHAIPLYAGDTAPIIFADREATAAEAIARRRTHFIVRNSWGPRWPRWGDGGFA